MKFRYALPVALLLAVVSCQDGPDQSLGAPNPEFVGGVACSINGAKSAAKTYFTGADQARALGLIEQLQQQMNGSPAVARDLGFDVLALIAEANNAGRAAGKPKDGSTLANAVVACTDLNEGYPDPLGDALRNGAFEVRGGPNDPTSNIVSKDGFSGLGLNGDATWLGIFGRRTLIWGTPAPRLTFQEVLVDIPFIWSTLPASPQVPKGLIVGFCVPNPGNLRVAEQSANAPEVILNLADPSFFLPCPNLIAGREPATMFGRVLAWAGQALLPAPLHAAARLGPVGGSTTGFSGFGAVDAQAINLSFTQQPTASTVRQPFVPPVQLIAVGNGGTPLPQVTVKMSLVTLQGNGILDGQNSVVTVQDGLATFDRLFLTAPGTYQLVATASLSGFPSVQVTSSTFTVQ